MLLVPLGDGQWRVIFEAATNASGPAGAAAANKALELPTVIDVVQQRGGKRVSPC